MSEKRTIKELQKNCESDFINTPISVLKYLTELEMRVIESENKYEAKADVSERQKCRLEDYGRLYINNKIDEAKDAIIALTIKVGKEKDKLVKKFLETNISETKKYIKEIKELIE